MIGDAVIKSQDSRNLVMTLSVVWQRHRYMSGSRVVRPSRFLSLASILIILSITSVYNTARGPGEYAEQIWNTFCHDVAIDFLGVWFVMS